jgi:predicted permease
MKFSMFVSGNFFQVFGVTPQMGRRFRLDEDKVVGRDAVTVLSHDLWVSEFAASSSVLGRTIFLNGVKFTIIGVAPETFTGLGLLKPALYVPIAMSPTLVGMNNLEKREIPWLDVKGRLTPSTNIAQAGADIDSLAAGLRSLYPKSDQKLKLKVETVFQLRSEQSPPTVTMLVMLATLALCVLLVACANVSGLLLSRSSVRAREIALRLAVGATRASLIRQLFIENLLLALAGAAAGLVVAQGAVKFLASMPMPTDLAVDFSVRLDRRALLFTLAAAVFSTFVFGLTPALGTVRVDLVNALKGKAGTQSRLRRLWGRNLLVSGQIALSLTLLILSAVLLDGFHAQLDQGPGYRIDHLQLMSFDPSQARYTGPQQEQFYRQLLDRLKRAPGVSEAALASNIPMSLSILSKIAVVPEGYTLESGEEAPSIFDNVVTPDYFRTLAIPILEGRGFLESDKANSQRVAIVNEKFARHYWPKQSAIGKQFRVGDVGGERIEVVGVAKTSKYLWITEGETDYIYLPFSQHPQAYMGLAVHSKSADPATLVPSLRQIVQSLDRDMPTFQVRTMKNLYEMGAIADMKIMIQTVTGLGFMGLILALIGLHGVVSYTVRKRSREFGIRMAIGARRWKIMQMVLQQSLILGIGGISAGLIAGILASRAVTSFGLFSVPLRAFPVFAVSFLLLLTVVFAGFVPARRASLIDPMNVLREE